MNKITVFIHNEIKKQIQRLYEQGGNFQKAAEKCKILLYDLTSKNANPIEVVSKIPMTNHGESRIKHCVKYDLSGFCRLVTIQDNGWLVLLFCGTHDEVERWLENNKGLKVAITDAEKGLFEIFKSDDITDVESRLNLESDFSSGKLYLKLKHYWDLISSGIPALIRKEIESFETITEETEIYEAAVAISDPFKQDLFFDVFMLLRGGKVDEAKNRILAFQEVITLINDIPEVAIREVRSNDQYINLDDLEEGDLKILMNNKNWLEWMLFMHPAQKTVVDRDFNGSARLLGVSGSGKTCVVVKRSVRLAKKYPGQKILILTLNQSLSNLISSLITRLLECGENEVLRDQIEVKSFWEISRDLIIEFRNHAFDKRVLGPKTDKYEETIDEIWDEFYLCRNNNNDAEVLFPTHCNLLTRGVYPQDYLKQEFDWIRSFLPKEKLQDYLLVEREGRSIPLIETEREKILEGLKGWESKMAAVGAIDYLGLTNELYTYIDRINSRYRCILVDEVQDFSTLELSIIRKLVEEGENDLFLTGDIAQQVYSKHHKIRNAGITILPDSYLKILKNYRNSREILSAAYELFRQNTKEEQYKSDDFEILNPEYANFSSAKPHLRKAKNPDEELTYAIQYLSEILGQNEKGCIAFCGYSLFNMQVLGLHFNCPVLDGSAMIGDENIYLSDLEQTKGFEFDRMIIINANNHVLPNPSLPADEWFREISKFYVAMTRAKKELIISYSGVFSSLFDNCLDFFTKDSWEAHISDLRYVLKMPSFDKRNFPKSQAVKMLGKDFLFHKKAVGMSRELQNKLMELVQGRSITLRGKKEGWIHMDELKNDIEARRDLPNLSKNFGPVVFKELERILTRDE